MVRPKGRIGRPMRGDDFIGQDTPKARGQAAKATRKKAWDEYVFPQDHPFYRQTLSALAKDHVARDAPIEETREIMRMLGMLPPEYVWVKNGLGETDHHKTRVTLAEYEEFMKARAEAVERNKQRAAARGGLPLSDAEAKLLASQKADDSTLLRTAANVAVKMFQEWPMEEISED